MSTQIFHRTATVKGRKIINREAGDPVRADNAVVARTADEQPDVPRI